MRITPIEPTMAITPIASGIAAASRPPKIQMRTTKHTGSAMASMVSRSLLPWSFPSMKVAASPPALTVTPSRSCSRGRSSLVFFCAPFSPPLMPARMSPVLPSLLTSALAAADGDVHADCTPATKPKLLS
jgi:hypothetical protein